MTSFSQPSTYWVPRISWLISSAGISLRIMSGPWRAASWDTSSGTRAFCLSTYLQQKTRSTVSFALEWIAIHAFWLMPSNWTGGQHYCMPFPPVALIPQIILKLKLDHTKLILIALAWSRHCFFSSLHSLSVQFSRRKTFRKEKR